VVLVEAEVAVEDAVHFVVGVPDEADFGVAAVVVDSGVVVGTGEVEEAAAVVDTILIIDVVCVYVWKT